MPQIENIEDARAEILRLQEQVTTLETERDTLSQNNKSLSEELTRVRALNQTFFEKLSQQVSTQNDKDDPDPDPVPCEEYATTITI